MNENKFNIGDTAYHAHAGQEQTWITCPECLGSGRLRVIMGDDSEVSIACVCCERGYEGSLGKIQTYKFRASVDEVVIHGVESELRGDELHTQYKFNGCYLSNAEDLFNNRDEALTRANELVAEHEVEEVKRLKYKEKQTKTWAWNVSYWRGQIRGAKETIVRAEAHLNVAPKKPKEADKVACTCEYISPGAAALHAVFNGIDGPLPKVKSATCPLHGTAQ